MGYILKAPTGGGGGDATAANQVLQLAQDATAANQVLQLAQIDDVEGSVFKDRLTNTSLFFKTLRSNNSGLGITHNTVSVISFTAATAPAVAILLQNFLALNDCYIINICSSQGAGTHDLFLTYSI